MEGGLIVGELPGSEVLLTVAEVSVAFLGFTGVVGIFAWRETNVVDVSLRFWVMVAFALGTLLLAFLPFVLHYLGLQQPGLWAACSAAVVLLCVGHTVLALPTVLRERRAGRWRQPLILELFPFIFLTCFVTQSLNALGILFERTLGGYLLGLFLLLACSGFNFVSLLVALRGAQRPAV